mmetsp:Transcript_26759/g.32832  ORF Transcript_26759/g.32832 Transcript_26759/m.32832 type:complete len:159 (-) Transcript_26759:169-645(-)
MTAQIICPQEKPKKRYQGIVHNQCRFNHKGRRKGGLSGPYSLYNCMKNRGGSSVCTKKIYMFDDLSVVENGEHGQYCHLARVPIQKLQEDATKRTASPKKNSFGGFKFGGSKKTNKPTKDAMQDATELTRFALAALKSNDADLAADRLEKALAVLGRR